MFRPKPNW